MAAIDASTVKTPHRYCLGMRVDATSYADATLRIGEWAKDGQSRYVCVANVHMTMEAWDSPAFKAFVNGADLVTPDGMPLVWALRLLGVPDQERVYGPELTLRICDEAARLGIPVALYGGRPGHLDQFAGYLLARYPGLRLCCRISPRFGELSLDEIDKHIQQLTESGARIILVGLGCPKQELWMAENTSKLSAVLVGVGAAFDFHSGRVKQAPPWVQRIGMEWFFRLLMEPRRLWKRYLKHNPRFVLLFLMQLLGIRRFGEVTR